jgi:hypothetical protein
MKDNIKRILMKPQAGMIRPATVQGRDSGWGCNKTSVSIKY